MNLVESSANPYCYEDPETVIHAFIEIEVLQRAC